jgi:chromosome segregation protein
MQLKSLEIHGFKSFADKTKFIFDAGITGVVGPNGCGKSNIVDSIRWVLGEQKTRNLRSEKMENIIFNGTSKRKKSNFAQVTLTFENTKNILPTEFSTVAVTRKLYRDGESEYLINNIPCRLKDIQNLFLDTGIGPDSYAIIELKMVDEILNDKENSRRILFEEAAGISKYKIRKKQTLLKLKGTEDDLARVEDVLFEIEKQLKTLESQAKKARKYFELKEEYKILSSQYAYFTIRHLREKYERIEKEEQGMADLVTEVQSQIARSEARIQELKKEQVDREQELSAAQKDLNRHNEKIQEIEKEKSIKNERLKYLQQREFAINDSIETDRRSRSRLLEEQEFLRLQGADTEREVKQNEGVLQRQKEALDRLRSENESLKARTFEMAEEHRQQEQQLMQLQKDKEIKQIQIDGYRKEIQRHQDDATKKNTELDAFGGRVEQLEKEIADLDKVVTDLRAQKQANEEAREASSKRLDELKDQIYRTNRGLDARMNEYELTKSLVENLEGFPESVKFLKKEANWVKDAPLLSDVFYTDEAFKVAFENLLEPYLSYYVVDTRTDALTAVKLLGNASKGRANFFVLEELATYQSPAALSFEGARSALELVEFNEKYRSLALYLLDKVFVVEDEDKIPSDIPAGVFFLTRSGTLLRRRFSLSGGSIGLFQGKRLGRAKNLEKLDKEIKKHELDLNELKLTLDKEERTLFSLKEFNYGQELDRKQRELNQRNQDYSILKAREKEYRDFILQAGERVEVIEREIEVLQAALAAIGPRMEELQKEYESQSTIFAQSKNELDQSNAELAAMSEGYNQKNIAFIQLRNKLENLNRDLQQRVQQLEQIAGNEVKNKADLEQTQKDIHEIVENNMQNDEEIVGLYEEKKVRERKVEDLEQAYALIRSQISQQDDIQRAERRRKEEIEAAKAEMKDRVTEVKIELNTLRERMEVEFQINIADLDEATLFADGVENYDPPKVEDKMLKSRAKIQNYGEINPMAVEAYDEMKARFDFISSQKQDLVEAKDTLMQTIAEIDETATKNFMEAFINIRENFKKVFQSLFFEGDTCDLMLENEGDPLESRIEIIARPKGKRPLTINQLSGGEKTLTAVALLFGIYLLKPAPFCIFDEVDAPLDDANIDKFNNIIREFSMDSQFIIVTHNKRTMAATNVMYGVTMEEQGVSKVMGVDLVALGLS